MPRVASNKYVADWVRQIDTERMSYSQRHRDQLEPEFKRLRETLADSSRRMGVLLDEPHWRPLIAGPLQDSVNHVRDLLRLLRVELVHTQTEAATIAAPATLRNIANAGSKALKTVESNLVLSDRFTRYAGELYAEFDRLLQQQSPSPARLQNLARRILLEVRHEMSFENMVILSDERLDHGLSSAVNNRTRAIVASSIRAAWWMAWTVERLDLWADRRELLTVAAMLLDVGRLVPDSHQNDTGANHPPAKQSGLDRQHPSLSAGLAAGLHELSSILPIWVSEHHERLDGTGSPRGLRGRHLSGPSRLLAIVARFSEQVRDAQQTVEPTSANADRTAAPNTAAPNIAAPNNAAPGNVTVLETLRMEAERGELDPRLTERFVSVLETELAAAVRSTPTIQFEALDRTWRVESSHALGEESSQRVSSAPNSSQIERAGHSSEPPSSMDSA
jgi:HD-GYP domain-containing protein (c-di-GMP phosphodiesterase class II)